MKIGDHSLSVTPEQATKMDDEELERLAAKQQQQKKPSTQRRSFKSGWLKWLIYALTISMACYHIYTTFVSFSPHVQRAGHLVFVLVLVFLLYPARVGSPTNRPSVFDWALVTAAIISVGNLLYRFPAIARAGGRGNDLDLFLGVIVILLVLECARRTVGLILPGLAVFMISYGFWGQYLSGPLMHAGFSWRRIVAHLTLTTEGIYGQILGVSSTYIFMFVLFGAFLGVSGASGVFNDISLAVAGSRRGGPAKVAVLGSAMVGTIIGSAAANVVATGSFTIPLMLRLGYKNFFASAVEAAASTGGQILPPVMGAAAFIIADTLGIPFLTVARAALLPAILYFISVWFAVDLRARKENISGLNKEELPCLKTVLLERGHLLAPLFVIIGAMIIGYRPTMAAIYGITATIVVSFLRRSTWMNPKQLLDAMSTGALNILPIAAGMAVIGNIIGIASLSGAILTLGAVVMRLGSELLILTLVLTMLAAIGLGLGLPTTAAYILSSTVAAPALIHLGIMPLSAHLFVFYYAILSAITPPVNSCSYAAAGLSGANPNVVAIQALRLALAGFIIPFMFIFNPELLLPSGVSILAVARAFITVVIGIFGLALFVEGFYHRKLALHERIMCGIGAICLIGSGWINTIVGIFLIGIVVMLNFAWSRTRIATS